MTAPHVDDPWSSLRGTALGAELVATVAELQRLRAVASGAVEADLILRGGTVLSVHTGEFLPRDVVISGRHIAAVTPVGEFDAKNVNDVTGRHIVPTFVDTHLHIEYTMLTPGEMARVSVPRGTVTVLADPNCIANVIGAEGMDIVGTTSTPLRIFRQVSHRVPRTPDLELGGAVVDDAEIAERVQASLAVTLGESNPFDLDEWSAVKQVAALTAGKRLTGHTARLGGPPLWSYLAGGISDDHNAVTTEEVLERLRLGAMLTVMSGSMNDNCQTVFADLDALGDGLFHISFCADDKHVEDLAEQGHIDHHVRQAIAHGVPIPLAYRMATYAAALHYRFDHVLGSITPSRIADILVIDDLAQALPDQVYVAGALVAEHGQPLFVNTDPIPDVTRNTVRLHPNFGPSAFAVSADTDTAWVQGMEMYDGYFKRAFHVELPVINGCVQCDPDRDVAKVAVVDRHHATQAVGVGYVRGFGLKRGALAATTNCENQNLVMVGTSDEELAFAAAAAREMGGGYVAVADGQVLGSVPLPIAGIMSDLPWEQVAEQSRRINGIAASLGCEIPAPFMIMAFVGLAGVPDLGLTERGLIETASQSFVDVVLTQQAGMVCCRCPNHAHDVHMFMDPTTSG